MNYQLKIQIQGITKPPVWRRVIVSENATFGDLHEVIQCVFGWYNYHLYQFKDKEWGNRIRISEPSEYDDMYEVKTQDAYEVLLKDYFQGQVSRKIFYEYDFGDSWMHVITLEEVKEEEGEVPFCVNGKGACPPEDCGGVGGYAYMKEVFEQNPKGKEAKHYREWMGMKSNEIWDAKLLDLDEINEELIGLR